MTTMLCLHCVSSTLCFIIEVCIRSSSLIHAKIVSRFSTNNIFEGIDSNLKNILEFDTNKCEETESETSYSLWLKERLLRIISKSVKTGL